MDKIFLALPHDVSLISKEDLRHLGHVDLLITDWPCQCHSCVGAWHGLDDPRSIFVNWTKKKMCGDYFLVNKKTKSDRYSMPTPKYLFKAVGYAQDFSTLDLRFGYH